MKFYIASRTARAADVKKMAAELESLGHEVSHDWTAVDTNVVRPYSAEVAERIAKKDLQGVLDADIFILLGDQQGTGMYVEMGVALAVDRRVFVIGPSNDTTVFHFLPQVRRVNSFEEVLKELRMGW